MTTRTKLLAPAIVDDAAAGACRRFVDEQVPDRGGLAYWILMLIGVGSLLPWNALITPIEYLKLRIAGSPFEASFESVFSTSFTSISLVVLFSMQAFFLHTSVQKRIIGSLILLLMVFIVLTAVTIAPLTWAEDGHLLEHLRDGADAQFAILIACAMLAGVGQAILSGSAMGYAALFSLPNYLQAVSGGQGVAGCAITIGSLLVSLPGISSVCNDASADAAMRVAAPDSDAHAREVITAAAVYFGATCFILVCCIVGFGVVESLPFTRARKRLLVDDVTASYSHNATVDPAASSGPVDAPPSAQPASAASAIELESALNADEPTADATSCGLLFSLWKWTFSVCLIYIVTIAIFPSLTSTIVAYPSANATAGVYESTGQCEWSHLFVPLGFVFFNVGDTIGRNMPSPLIIHSPNVIFAMTVARVAFAPLFMLCHTEQGGGLQLGYFGANDALALVIMSVFSVTNGWITSSIFVASQSVLEPHQRNPAATLLVLMLNTGIAIGAALSFVVRYLDCTPNATNAYSCNPFIAPPLNGTA